MKTKAELKESLGKHVAVARDRYRRAIELACTEASEESEGILEREMNRWLWLSRLEVYLDEFFQAEERQEESAP